MYYSTIFVYINRTAFFSNFDEQKKVKLVRRMSLAVKKIGRYALYKENNQIMKIYSAIFVLLFVNF